mgnify:FL=1
MMAGQNQMIVLSDQDIDKTQRQQLFHQEGKAKTADGEISINTANAAFLTDSAGQMSP